MTSPIWTISNLLSILRVFLVLPIGTLLSSDPPGSRTLIVGCIILAIATDFLDGMLARRFHQVSEVGKVLDPLADKLAVGIIVLILVQLGKIPLWFALAVIARDVSIVLGGMYVRKKKGILLQSNQPGKWAVTAVALLILVAVIDSPQLEWLKSPLLALCMVMLCLSMFFYTQRFVGILRQPAGVTNLDPTL